MDEDAAQMRDYELSILREETDELGRKVLIGRHAAYGFVPAVVW